MTKDEALKVIEDIVADNSTPNYGMDREKLHEQADALLVRYLKELGPEHAEVAVAFEDLDKEYGFWYS